MSELKLELRGILNKYNAENRSNTPDFVLAEFLLSCLDAFDKAVNARAMWRGEESEGKDDEKP